MPRSRRSLKALMCCKLPVKGAALAQFTMPNAFRLQPSRHTCDIPPGVVHMAFLCASSNHFGKQNRHQLLWDNAIVVASVAAASPPPRPDHN